MKKSILKANLDFNNLLVNLHLYMEAGNLIFELRQKIKHTASTLVEALVLDPKDINSSSSCIVELLKEKDLNSFSIDWQGVLGGELVNG